VVEYDEGKAVEEDRGDIEGVITRVGDVGQAGQVSAHFRDGEQPEPRAAEDGGPFPSRSGRGEQSK
jgi:hypothetical protein